MGRRKTSCNGVAKKKDRNEHVFLNNSWHDNYRIVLREGEVGLFTVDVPPQLGSRLWPVRRAVDVDLVADVVTREAAGNNWAVVRKIWKPKFTSSLSLFLTGNGSYPYLYFYCFCSEKCVTSQVLRPLNNNQTVYGSPLVHQCPYSLKKVCKVLGELNSRAVWATASKVHICGSTQVQNSEKVKFLCRISRTN